MRTKDPFTIQVDNKQIKNKELRDYSQKKEMGGSVPLAEQEKEPITLTIDFKRVRWLFYIIIFSLIVILLRTGYLQIVKGKEYSQSAEENRIRIESVKASRGIIHDRNNNVLVHNIPNFILNIIPADLPKNKDEQNKILNKVSSIIDLNTDQIRDLINAVPSYSYQPVTIKENIDYQKALLLEIETANMPGVKLEVAAKREYLAGNAFSQLLGYTGKITKKEFELSNTDQNQAYLYDDYLGKTGLELYYETELRGKYGKKQIEVDSLGKEKKILFQNDPVSGNNLVLNINSQLQERVYDLINKKVNSSKSITGAAAVVLNPKNGDVLALTSAPNFDNNKFVTGLDQAEFNELLNDPKKPLFNRAVAGEYPSGSTIKPVIASAALQDKIIDTNTTFNSTGGIKIDKWFFPDWKAGGHGVTDVRKAIAESVNTFFYMISGGDENFNGLGVDKIKKYAEFFGLNQKLGIDLPGETTGFLPSQEWKERTKGEKWYIGDTYHLGIGQGDLLVTPLQVASYTAAIANGGTLYKPHVVKEITDAEDNITKAIKPEIIREGFIDPQNIKIVKEGMRQAVTSGSSRGIGDLPFTSAGKTGTAQFGSEGKTHAWFTAFAPYEDPQIVVTVLVEAGGEGNEIALPIAKNALSWWFANK